MILKDRVNFIKKNYIVLYSFLLIIIIAGVILFGNYYSLKKFEYNTNRLLQSKAILAEDIFNILISEEINSSNEETLNQKIKKIIQKDSEIKKIELLVPDKNNENYNIIASSNEENIGAEVNNELARTAFVNDSGIAFLNTDSEGRYWEVVKVVKNNDGKRIGIVSFQMSLVEHDNFIESSIQKVYIVLSILMLLVLLVIANHVRFFHYALKATKLEEVDKMKDDFISMASHELKSPLTSIRGYVEILKDSITNKEKISDNKEILNNIESSTLRLNDLVIDLLEVSRLEQNRVPIKIENIDMAKIIRDSIKELSINAKNKGLELIYSQPEKISFVSADKKRVKQIVINLLSNAIKYTPKGKVEVKIEEDNKNVSIIVADTGLGISAENLKSLFSKFYRVKTDETARISGTGLGLWISREFARKMNGDLTVESIEGVGSHFTLRLKKAK